MIELQQNIDLSNWLFFKTTSVAKYLVELKESDDFYQLPKIIMEKQIDKIMVLGAGSNVLISGKGWDGLVIKNSYTRLERLSDDRWVVGAGVLLPYLSFFLAKQGYAGLEHLGNIPGTVGGAIRGNAEAWRQSISDYLQEVVWVDWLTGEEEILTKEKCQFAYRTSIFKTDKKYQRGLIKEAIFAWPLGKPEELQKTILADRQDRKQKQPDWPSCGCFFKNVLLTERNWSAVENFFGEEILSGRKIGDNFSAGKLIDACDLKGKRVGGAVVSDVHANFIVNQDGATAQDIWLLAKIVREEVQKKIGIELENEVQIYGKFK